MISEQYHELRLPWDKGYNDNLQTAQPARKKNENELSAGDTKLLDKYLSFMQPGA